MRQNKYELRISILFIFRHCFMLPFSPYAILLITLNAMLVASSERIFFFYVSPFTGLFLDKFSLQDFFFGEGDGGGIVTSLPVVSNGPSLSTNKISFSWSSSSQNLKLFIVSVKGFTGFVCGRNTRRKADSSKKYI